jgi:hypothetical protein
MNLFSFVGKIFKKVIKQTPNGRREEFLNARYKNRLITTRAGETWRIVRLYYDGDFCHVKVSTSGMATGKQKITAGTFLHELEVYFQISPYVVTLYAQGLTQKILW